MPEGPEHGETVHARHDEIEKHEFGFEPRDSFKPRDAVLGRFHAVALTLKKMAQELADIGNVLNDENLAHDRRNEGKEPSV